MAQQISPLKRVQSCDRFNGPHVHTVTDLGKESCITPLFILEREAALLSPGSGLPDLDFTHVTLMTAKKKPSGSASSKVSPHPATGTAPTKAAPNPAITEKAQEANGSGAEFRGVASLTWNYAVIFPSALRQHLPFKYVGKANRVKIQVDIVGDTVVLSRYMPPASK